MGLLGYLNLAHVVYFGRRGFFRRIYLTSGFYVVGLCMDKYKQYGWFYPDGWEWRKNGPSSRRVQGVGLNDSDYAVALRVQGRGRTCPVYQAWKGVLERCYCSKFQIKRPTYVGVTCDEEWLVFSSFQKWYLSQLELAKKHIDENERLVVDKDILTSNRTYGPTNCLLIPEDLNKLTLGSKASRGQYPIGVTRVGKRFQARIRLFGEMVQVGCFGTPEEAGEAYKVAKLKHVRAYHIPEYLPVDRVRERLIEIVQNQD